MKKSIALINMLLFSAAAFSQTLEKAMENYIPQPVAHSERSKFSHPAIKEIPPVAGAQQIQIRRLPLSYKASASSTASFFEGFEISGGSSWDYMPEGWIVKSNPEESADPMKQWFIYSCDAEEGLPPAAEGKYYAMMPYDEGYKDEWLISSSFPVVEGQILSVYTWISPLDLFELSQDNVDFQKFEWKRKVKQATLQILIKEEGNEEWTVLKDCFDDYADWTFKQCMSRPQYLEERVIDIQRYVGKDVRVAFRYVGKNSDFMCVDAVSVDYPRVEVAYEMPEYTLYWGAICDAELTRLSDMIAHYPAYTPLTWRNISSDKAASYKWQYQRPDTHQYDISAEKDLTITYYPDYTSQSTALNNFIDPVILNATKDDTSGGSYSGPVDFFQVGGEPTIGTDAGKHTFGLLPFNIATAKQSLNLEGNPYPDEEYIPTFGYYYINGVERSTQWMTLHYFNNEPGEHDKARLSAYSNYIAAPESPLVIKGMWANAVASLQPEAEIVFSVYGIDGEGNRKEKIGEAKCYGKDTSYAWIRDWEYRVFPFEFDPPIVLSNEKYAGYLLEITGFDNPETVIYFNPVKSLNPSEDGICHGYVTLDITTAEGKRTELVPISEFEGEGASNYCAFYLNLDACYPYLVTEEADVIEIARGEEKIIEFDSWYGAEDFTVTTQGSCNEPEAWVEGRFADFRLHIKNPDCLCESVHYGKVTISSPGFSKTFTYTEDLAGVGNMMNDNGACMTDIYTPDGRKGNLSVPGLYIIRYSDGSTKKTITH